MRLASRIDGTSVALDAGLRVLALNWRCPRHPQAGGSETNLFEQARRWTAAGHQVTVFCSDPGRERAPVRDEELDGISLVRRGGTFTVYLWAALFLLLHSRSFDRVLDVANGIPFFAPLLCRRPGTLLVHHVHGRQWFAEFPAPAAAVGWALERWAVPLVYRRWPVVAVSPTTRDALVQTGVREKQVQIVYNGVEPPSSVQTPQSCDTEPGAPYSQPRYRRGGDDRQDPDQRLRFAYVGRIKRYKRLERLVEMMPALLQRFPNLELEIAGSGDDAPRIEGLIERLGLEDSVSAHGFVDEAEKARILSRADVFATPSMHEGWGLSVIEANSYGCPAVAYDVPGLSAAILHGQTGLLASDDDSLRRALAFLLSDDHTRERYGENARQWARGFSWEACAEQTLATLYAGRPERLQSVAGR